MYALNTIHTINARAAAAPSREDAFSRHCSYVKQDDGGIVLHSAKQRSTGYIYPDAAKRFEAQYLGTNSVEGRDALIESYFRTIPTGKQRIVTIQ